MRHENFAPNKLNVRNLNKYNFKLTIWLNCLVKSKMFIFNLQENSIIF